MVFDLFFFFSFVVFLLTAGFLPTTVSFTFISWETATVGREETSRKRRPKEKGEKEKTR